MIEDFALTISNFGCLDINSNLFIIFRPSTSLYSFIFDHNFKIFCLVYKSLCKEIVERLPQILQKITQWGKYFFSEI